MMLCLLQTQQAGPQLKQCFGFVGQRKWQEVHHLLLEVIREHINSEFANWEDFTKAIKAISKSSIDDALEKTKMLRRTIDES